VVEAAPQLLGKEMMMSFRQRVIAGYKKMLVQVKKDFKRDNRLLHGARADSVGRTSLKVTVKDHKNRIKMCVREIANLERGEKSGE
jgi:hypothetical protein